MFIIKLNKPLQCIFSLLLTIVFNLKEKQSTFIYSLYVFIYSFFFIIFIQYISLYEKTKIEIKKKNLNIITTKKVANNNNTNAQHEENKIS